MVLVVLAGIWAAVLLPPMLRSRSEARPADSIGNFRHQLHVLQRTGPISAVRTSSDSVRTPGVAPMPPMPAARLVRSQSPQAARKARTLKRRRDVLAVLLAGMTGTLVLGLFPSMRVLLGLHLALDLLFVGFVALLVRARNATAEREMKLRFLPATQPDNVVLFRRSAT